MKKRFDIKRTPEIVALCAKYEGYTQDYIPGAEEESIFRVMPFLSEWEKVVLYALTEYKSYRKFAKFFGIGDSVARATISDIRARMKDLLKRNF